MGEFVASSKVSVASAPTAILADQLVAGRDDAGSVDYFEYVWNEFGRDALAGADGLLFALVYPLVDCGWDA